MVMFDRPNAPCVGPLNFIHEVVLFSVFIKYQGNVYATENVERRRGPWKTGFHGA